MSKTHTIHVRLTLNQLDYVLGCSSEKRKLTISETVRELIDFHRKAHRGFANDAIKDISVADFCTLFADGK